MLVSRGNVLMFHLDPTKLGYKGIPLANLYLQLLERIETTPGVQSATLSLVTPISGGGWNGSVAVEGYNPIREDLAGIYLNSVGPYSLRLCKFHFSWGGILLPRVHSTSPKRSPSVDETMARKHFFGRNPLGRHFGPRQGNAGANSKSSRC